MTWVTWACVQIFCTRFKAGPARQGWPPSPIDPPFTPRDQALLEAKPPGRSGGGSGNRSARWADRNRAPGRASCRLRPSYGRLAGTGPTRGPTLMFVAGLTEGGGRRCLRQGAKLPATRRGPPPPAPRRQTGRGTSPAVRCLSRSGPILPKKPTLRRLGRLPLVCGRRRGVRTKGVVRGCATLERLRSRPRHTT